MRQRYKTSKQEKWHGAHELGILRFDLIGTPNSKRNSGTCHNIHAKRPMVEHWIHSFWPRWQQTTSTPIPAQNSSNHEPGFFLELSVRHNTESP